MIETTQWLAQIALKSNLNEATCKQLWKQLLDLLSNRLASGITSSLEGFFTLSAVKEPEYIALLPDGQRLLVPPQIKIAATPPSPSKEKSNLTLLLSDSSDATLETVETFIQHMATLFQEHINKGHELNLELLGHFSPLPQEKGFIFSPAQELIDKVNKPFKSFPITPIPEEKTWVDVEIKKVTDKDAILRPYSLILHQQEGLQENVQEEISTSSSEENTNIQPLVTPQEQALPSELTVAPPPLPTPPPLPFETNDKEIKEGNTTPAPSTSEEKESVIAPSLSQDSVQRKQSSKKKYLLKWGCALLAGWATWMLMQHLPEWIRMGKPTLSPMESVAEPPSKKSVATQDTVSLSATSDTLSTPKVFAIEPIEEQYIEVERGKRLVDYARTTYGNKRFWIYIYLANRSVIKDPNNVPLGSRLRLPSAQEYGINAADSLSVQKADSLIRAYHNDQL